ncbi:pol [Fowl aviadenovirus A]|nr:pol [Fowl aviadenovirus A]
MEADAGPPLTDSVLGPDSHVIRTISAKRLEETRKYFKSFRGNPLRTNVYYIEEQPFRFQPTVFPIGLKKFLRTHRFLLSKRARGYDRIDYLHYARDPERSLPDFKPAQVTVIDFKGKTARLRTVHISEHPALPPMLIAKNVTGEWVWITSRTPVQQCPTCGRHWVRRHSCNERRSAFYYHAVQGSGSDLWQHVHFSCPAQHPHIRQLYITYDIETYTVFEKKGKRMHPFMLCFMLSGDPQLVSRAERLARQDDRLKALDEGFYWLDSHPGEVARRFRNFRSRLQIEFAQNLVDRYAAANRDYCDQLVKDGKYGSVHKIPYELFEKPTSPLSLPDNFYSVDIVVLGHNICKFDELLLATELVERRDLFPEACKCDRSFMPRVGRLLFNDIIFRMPNPNYVKKDASRVERWSRGIVSHQDARSVFVRFMVRDTLQLTSGAKLSKAAAAYALDLCKGHCPYEAINEFISTGRFHADADGFPVERYWEDPSVIAEQKNLWQKEHPGQQYDIVQACLEYCMQDVRVTQKLAHTLHDSYDAYFQGELGMEGHFNIFVRPTIPSNTHAFWKQLTFSNYVREQRATCPPSVPEPPKKKGRTKKKKQPSPDYVAEVYAPHRPMFKYIRQALRGGRCYPNVLGPYPKPVYVFDICGMYASALTHPMPHGMPLDPKFTAQHVEELNRLLTNESHLSYFDARIKPSILKIEAYPPPPEMLDPLPPICSRRGGRLVWTNEALYDEVVTVIDILTLHNRGWRVQVLHDEMNIVFPEWKTLCADYVTKNILAKEKADREKNEVIRSISKMLSNALYGAFATNMDTTRIIFEQDLSEADKKNIYEGTEIVKHVTLLNDDSFNGTEVTLENAPNPFSEESLRQQFRYADDPEQEEPEAEEDGEEEGDDSDRESARKPKNALTEDDPLVAVDLEVEATLATGPYIPEGELSSAHYARANETRFKPMRLLEATPEALTVLHLESLDKQVANKRYATQIACFVLGWSRAFFSEWCDILYGPDRGVHILRREEPRSLYGDTDSLFVTETGYHRMKSRGAHRIKTESTRLTFDPENPGLYWACDCDIKCKACGSDTYSSETIFLAPKLYGLKNSICVNEQCRTVGPGKIRSKGHRQSELIYDTLLRCWRRHEDVQFGAQSNIPELHTRRTIFKTTLLNKVSRYDPFTIHNEQLTRVLRPWKDLTLYEHGDYLYPYDNEHPNPRTTGDVRPVPIVGHEDPLAPLRWEPYAFLSEEECGQVHDLLFADDSSQEAESLGV